MQLNRNQLRNVWFGSTLPDEERLVLLFDRIEAAEARNRRLLLAVQNARGVLRTVRASDPDGDLACWAGVVGILRYLDEVIAAEGKQEER